MACHLGLAAAYPSPRFAVAASAAAGEPGGRIRRRPHPPPPPQQSVDEVRRAIGVAADPSSREKPGPSMAFMELLEATPIGQPEGAAERRLREAAEWVVDTTEARALRGQKMFLVLCMMVFPVWLFLLSVALGFIKLPFDVPDLDNLLM